MPCQNCGHNSWVTIGVKKYCTNCGSLQKPSTIVGAAHAVSGPQEAMSSIDGVSGITKPARPVPQPRPAQSIHTGPALASGGVLDLRTKPSGSARPVPPTPRPVTDIAGRPAAAPIAAPATPTASAPQPTAPEINDIPTPLEPIFTAPVAVAPTQPESKPQPSLSELAASLSSPAEAAVKTEAPSTKKVLSIGAAALAVVIMGGYIWLNNYSNLSLRTASSKAGIVASLPHYTPTGYKLSGPINYGTGFVSFNLKPRNNNATITVTQRRTDWDSASLLQLFVTPKSKDYVAVESQGLKIYVYGDKQATWVNRGLQFVIQANSSVSKEQLVKMAESL